MLIDLHSHTAGISFCARKDYKGICEDTLKAGIDGFVLTNHIADYYPGKHGLDYKGFCEKYLEEFYKTEKYGKEIGLKVFFGLEVTMDYHMEAHLLIYGADDKFLLSNPPLNEYSLEELYKLVKANNMALVQGHPFRNGYHVEDTRYLDGIEINCHPKHSSMSNVIPKIANDNKIMITCGGDYHADTSYRPKCGVYLPDDIKTGKDLANFILTTKNVKLSIHEQNAPSPHVEEYKIVR